MPSAAPERATYPQRLLRQAVVSSPKKARIPDAFTLKLLPISDTCRSLRPRQVVLRLRAESISDSILNGERGLG